MIKYCIVLLLSTAFGGSLKIDIVSLKGAKYIQHGGHISLNCSFSSHETSTSAWFKQTPGQKPLLITSAYHLEVQYHNAFNNRSRFNAIKEKNSFTLNISNAEPSDSATYYCAVSFYANTALQDWTVVVLKRAPKCQYSILQHPLLVHVELGGNTTLECSLLTESFSEDHSVYWFRYRSEESNTGIIYSHGNSDDECKKSSETDSTTQSCVYKLPKINISLSDTGTYYCAVAACGEILFGNGTKLDFAVKQILDPVILVLAASNIISMSVIIFMCRRSCRKHHKEAAEGPTDQIKQDASDEGLNYAALSFNNKPSTSRSNRRQQNIKDTEMYSHIIFHQ